MSQAAQIALAVRKTPVQARSAVTVGAIHEATIQVLLKAGMEGLTTTRVAERAGVSVGTLYQYYPNKQSLLFAILESHMNEVAEAVEQACENARGKPVPEMVKDVIEAFVGAKMKRPDISMGLYRIAADIGGPAIVKKATARSRKALEALLGQPKFVIQMLFAAMAGATTSVLQVGASPAMIQDLRTHLTVLCQSYVAATAKLPRD